MLTNFNSRLLNLHIMCRHFVFCYMLVSPNYFLLPLYRISVPIVMMTVVVVLSPDRYLLLWWTVANRGIYARVSRIQCV